MIGMVAYDSILTAQNKLYTSREGGPPGVPSEAKSTVINNHHSTRTSDIKEHSKHPQSLGTQNTLNLSIRDTPASLI
jgi:hypothetical protein